MVNEVAFFRGIEIAAFATPLIEICLTATGFFNESVGTAIMLCAMWVVCYACILWLLEKYAEGRVEFALVGAATPVSVIVWLAAVGIVVHSVVNSNPISAALIHCFSAIANSARLLTYSVRRINGSPDVDRAK